MTVIRPRPKLDTGPHAAEWNKQMKALTDLGYSHTAAVNRLCATNPELQRNYIAEATSAASVQRASLDQKKKPVPVDVKKKTATDPDGDNDKDPDNDDEAESASAEWQSRLRALTSRGMDRSVAVQKLAAADPELHARYVDEANGR